MSLPTYKELSNVVNDYLTKGSEVEGVQLDAKEDGEPGKLNVFPFARPGLVGAHLVYDSPKLNTTVESKISNGFQSWTDYLPAFIYRTKVGDSANTVSVNTVNGQLKVTSEHPVANLSCTTALLDGGASDANVTAKIQNNVFAGLSLQYDPKRSGVRDLTAVVVRYACCNIANGDILAKYSLLHGPSLHMRIPLHTYADAAVAANRHCFIAGVQGRSPCGSRMFLNANFNAGTYTTTVIRNMNDMWKFTWTMTAPFSRSGNAAAPRYGLKFTHMDATE